jgi:hypothetical protein
VPEQANRTDHRKEGCAPSLARAEQPKAGILQILALPARLIIPHLVPSCFKSISSRVLQRDLGDAGQKNVSVACPKGRFGPDVLQILSGVPSPSPVYRGSTRDARHDFYTCFLFGSHVWETWLGKGPPSNANLVRTSPKRPIRQRRIDRLGDAIGDALRA